MHKKIMAAASLAALVWLVSPAQAAEPLQFRTVMQELGRNMQVVVDAISREDWERVAETAPLIARHPQPPASEKMRIMQFMGADMAKFKAADEATHEAAHRLQHAAHERDGQQVIAAFQQVQTSCLGCHQAFRARFVQHFYGQDAAQPKR